MNLKPMTPPHIRMQASNRTVMTDMIIALFPLYFMAFYYYGLRSAVVGILSIVTCTVTESICVKMKGEKLNPRDLTSVVTGMILALMMPATIDFSIVVVAGVFAIAIAKQPFGGTGYNIFNPAAAGLSFVAICWPQKVFLFPVPFENLPLFVDETVKLVQSPAGTLSQGGIPRYDFIDMLLGNFPGPMGATNILVIMTCLLFLLIRKIVRWQTPVGFLSACFLMALLFHRAGGSVGDSLLFELFSGSLIFGAVFMVTEPVTGPKRDYGRFAFAFVAGVVNMLFRYFGNMEQSISFTILVMNVFVPLFDSTEEAIYRKIRRGEAVFEKFTIRKKVQ